MGRHKCPGVQRLTVVLVLNLSLVAGLVAVGAEAHSLGVLADGGDYLLDAAGAGLALLALYVSARQASLGRPPARLGATGATAPVNSGWLLVAVIVAYHAVKLIGKVLRRSRRPRRPDEIPGR